MPPPLSPSSPDNLVLLHGMFGRPEQWQSCADHQSGSWRVLNFPLPLLDVKADERAIVALGEHMIRTMDAAGMDHAVLAGNSLGGHIAARMALQFPDRVSGMVLTGSSGLFERGFSNIPRRPTEAWIRCKMAEVFHDPVHVTDELVEEMVAFLGNIRRVLHMVRIAKCAKRDSLRDVLHAIKCPVLLIWGENDDVTPPSVGREFHERLPFSHIHFIPRCGHVPMVEQPAVFNDLVAAFLSGLRSAPSCMASAMLSVPGPSLQSACA